LIHRKQPSRQRATFARTNAIAIRSISMLDIVMLALGFGFFAAGIGYAYACERL
jgi:hypothetical protein